MAIELEHMQDAGVPPHAFTIETVREVAGLADWVAVWLFPAPEDVRARYLDALCGRGLGDDAPWRYYLGRLDGKPVATSQLFVAAGVAGVHYVVTVPEGRRLGIGTAMTMHVLREARALGYRVAVLSASPEGIGIYRRLGFREYCWFHRYEWSPGAAGSSTK
jgi:GNAT superfamily N-acetyltransferase